MNFIDQKIKQRAEFIELNFEGLKMQKWNVPTDRVQRADEKTGVICLVIIFPQENLSVVLKCFDQDVANFLVSSAENTKKSHVLHFNNHNSENKHDFYHLLNILTPFFYLLFDLYLLVYLIFAFQELQNSISVVSHLPSVVVCKIHIYLQWWQFEACQHRYTFPT